MADISPPPKLPKEFFEGFSLDPIPVPVKRARTRQRIYDEPPLFLGVGGITGVSSGSSYATLPHGEICNDEVHRRMGRRTHSQSHLLGDWETGGPLDLRKSKIIHRPTEYVDLVGIGSPRRFYSGKFVPFGWHLSTVTGGYGPFEWDTHFPTFKAAHSAAEARAWEIYRPGKPRASAGQFVGELAEIPTIPLRSLFSKAFRLKNLGSEYLNIEFGWRPFLSDLRKMVELVQDLQKRLDQLRRDNGVNVRRKGIVNMDLSSDFIPGAPHENTMFPNLTSEFYLHGFTASPVVYRTVSVRSSFSARFRYWIPKIEAPDWEARATRLLFDSTLTPSLVWELTPWSWLFDWILNIGPVLSNLSENAAENLVADYAYLTSRLQYTETLGMKQILTSQLPQPTDYELSCSSSRVRYGLWRTSADPYGFGVKFSSLSDRKALILAALGISRFR